MNKYKIQHIYKDKYINILNKFYDNYKNSIDINLLKKEYNLMYEIMLDLVYSSFDKWDINFGENKYKKHLIYKTDKVYWEILSKLFNNLKKYC